MKQDIEPRNDKNKNHGLWILYSNANDNDKIMLKGQFINDLKHGYWIENWFGNKHIIRLYLK